MTAVEEQIQFETSCRHTLPATPTFVLDKTVRLPEKFFLHLAGDNAHNRETNHDGTRNTRIGRRFIVPSTVPTTGNTYHEMAEEIPTNFGQAYPSRVPAMGGNGGVDSAVFVEDCVLSRSE